MDINERIRICLILEEMRKNKEAANRYGLNDVSELKEAEDTKKEETR